MDSLNDLVSLYRSGARADSEEVRSALLRCIASGDILRFGDVVIAQGRSETDSDGPAIAFMDWLVGLVENPHGVLVKVLEVEQLLATLLEEPLLSNHHFGLGNGQSSVARWYKVGADESKPRYR